MRYIRLGKIDMKSVSPRKEKNDNMPSMCISSEGREVKTVFISNQTNQGQAESNLKPINREVIRCNSDLSNSFQIFRTRTIGMGHPGHYFHKALNSVTHKSRSQSLPSCLESKKVSCASNSESDKILEAPKEALEGKELEVITLKVNSVVSNETWFRTWPERGNDKLVSPHNNNINNCHPESEKSGSIENEVQSCPCSGKNNDDSQVKVLTGVSDNVYKNNIESCNSSEKVGKVETYALKTTQSSALWKSDLPTCDIESYNTNVQNASPLKSVCPLDSNNANSGKTPIPLTELLQNIPLAYSPVTRQLHIIGPSLTQQGEDLRKEVYQNGLKQPLECIEEEGHGDACRNLIRCGEDDSLSFESPQNTLQRFGASSLSRTDASSFSSIVSSLSDASPSSTNDDPDDCALTLHGTQSDSADCYFDEVGGTKSKRKGLSGFFSRLVILKFTV